MMQSGDLWNNLGYIGQVQNVVASMADQGQQWIQWQEGHLKFPGTLPFGNLCGHVFMSIKVVSVKLSA